MTEASARHRNQSMVPSFSPAHSSALLLVISCGESRRNGDVSNGASATAVPVLSTGTPSHRVSSYAC